MIFGKNKKTDHDAVQAVAADIPFITDAGLVVLVRLFDADISDARHVKYLAGGFKQYVWSLQKPYETFLRSQGYFKQLMAILSEAKPNTEGWRLASGAISLLGAGTATDITTVIKLAGISSSAVQDPAKIRLPEGVSDAQLVAWQRTFADEILPQVTTRGDFSIAGLLNRIGELPLNFDRLRLGKSPIKLSEKKYRHDQSFRSFKKARDAARKKKPRAQKNIVNDKGLYRQSKDRARRLAIKELVASRYDALMAKAASVGEHNAPVVATGAEHAGIDPDWFITYMSCAVYAINSPGNHPMPQLRLTDRAGSMAKWRKASYKVRSDEYAGFAIPPGPGKDARYN